MSPSCFDKSWWYSATAPIYARALPQNSCYPICPPRPEKVSVFVLQSLITPGLQWHKSELDLAFGVQGHKEVMMRGRKEDE